jgi:hypothetical protein
MARVFGLLVALAAAVALWQLVRRHGNERLKADFSGVRDWALFPIFIVFFGLPFLVFLGVKKLLRFLRGQPVNRRRFAHQAEDAEQKVL